MSEWPVFDDDYLSRLKVARWRDLQLLQAPGAEAQGVRKIALEQLIRNQTLIAAIEAARAEPAPSKEDLEGTDFEGHPLDPAHPWFKPKGA